MIRHLGAVLRVPAGFAAGLAAAGLVLAACVLALLFTLICAPPVRLLRV